MSAATISAALRRAVAERAYHCCEYCGISDEATLAPHEPDHIIGEQHGGETIARPFCISDSTIG